MTSLDLTQLNNNGLGDIDSDSQLNSLMNTGANGNAATNYGALGASAIGGIGGVLGSLFANNNVAMPDTSNLQSIINNAAAQQQGIVSQLPSQTAALGTTLGNSISQAENTATQNTGSAANNFLTQLGQTTDLEGQNLTQALNQQVYGALPAQQRQIMENATATGGTQRGAVGSSLNQAGQTAASNVASDEAAISEQALQSKAAGLTVVENATNQNIQNQLGISKDEALQIYQSGNQDAIAMMNQLLNISQNQEKEQVGLGEEEMNAEMAEGNAGIAGQNQLLNSLIGAGTSTGVAAMTA